MHSPADHRTVEEFADAEGVSVGGVYDALGDERRRTTLAVLADVTTPVGVDALAVAVANREVDPVREGVPEERVERVRAALDDTHLPGLDQAGLIEYDGDGTVESTVDGLAALFA